MMTKNINHMKRILSLLIMLSVFVMSSSFLTDAHAATKEEVKKIGDGWYYTINDQIQDNYTGIKPNRRGWWRIVKGKVDFSCNTVERNEYGWWYCKSGKVQFNYTGIKPNAYGWWRIVNGKVDFACNSVEKNEHGWWYCQGGKVQFNYTGVKKNQFGWWYVKNGKVDFNFTGFAQNEYGWWYCKNGKVQFDTNSVIKGKVDGTDAWWHVVGGKVTFDNTVASNEHGWWVIRNGKVDFSYNGVADNSHGTWKIENGKVNFNFTGSQTLNGTRYNFVGGKVTPIGNVFRSYSDSTCTVNVYKKWYAGSWCYCAHIQLTDYKRFGTADAYNSYGSRETVAHAGSRLGAILCVNGDYASNSAEPHAAVRKGTVTAKGSKNVYACEAYNSNTGLLFNAYEGYKYPGTNIKCSTYTYNEAVKRGLITDTFIFGPAGLNNGTLKGTNGGTSRPRTLIGTNGDPGDIWIVVAAGDYVDGESAGLTGYEGGKLLQDLGCTFGGHLDGGGSSAMYFRGELLVQSGRDATGEGVADFVYVK